MSEEKDELFSEKEELSQGTIDRLGKTGKFLLYGSIIIVWIVIGTLGLIDLWHGLGFLETPWIIFGLILSVVVVIVIVIPLFRSLKADLQELKKMKEQEEEIREE